MYSDGIIERGKLLFDSYMLGAIDFQVSDIVVDCGANYGDLWLILNGLISEENYITFEPGAREYLSVSKNALNGTHNFLGLSDANEIRKFYLNESYADSSLVEPLHFTDVIEIETVKLADYIKEQKINRIKLLKLEAEGFEPEILNGSITIFDRIEYIAVDGGYERGKKQDETLSKVIKILHENDFEVLSINFKWERALFRKKTKNTKDIRMTPVA